MGFAFGFQGPEQSTMAQADVQTEDTDAFNQGVLAGQGAAMNGLPFDQFCVDLNAEGPDWPEFGMDAVIEGGQMIWSIVKHGFALSLLEGVLLVVNLSIALETFSDDPETAIQQEATALQQLLQRMGITNSLELFIGGGVDTTQRGCELKLTPIFRSKDAATNSASTLGRDKWFVASWRTDQCGGATIVASSGNF
jgi:hypothetical protein